MGRRRRTAIDTSETRTVIVPPAHQQELACERITTLLQNGEMDLQGLLPWSSNYTFLANVCDADLTMLAIYKPTKGERPLWDFPYGTLCNREYGAYLVSEALGWNLVPITVLREGPHGVGSLQLFIDADQEQHYFTLKDAHRDEFKRMALFDALLNNTDRKGGHCLIDRKGKVWGIDHGLTFHAEPKLRTVIWDFAGQKIPKEMLDDLKRFEAALLNYERIARQLEKLIAPDELNALLGRLNELIKTNRFPAQHSDWYTVPWPPV